MEITDQERATFKKGDELRLKYINSLPQPLVAKLWNGTQYPVESIDVQTGILRIDVCGLLEVKEISDVNMFYDADWNDHHPDTFYTDYEPLNH